MPQEKHTSKTDAETRNFLYCLAGAVGTLLCCDIVRAGFYVFTDPPIAMGAAFLIILLSPLFSAPLGIVTFIVTRLAIFIFRLRPPPKAWLFTGSTVTLTVIALRAKYMFM